MQPESVREGPPATPLPSSHSTYAFTIDERSSGDPIHQTGSNLTTGVQLMNYSESPPLDGNGPPPVPTRSTSHDLEAMSQWEAMKHLRTCRACLVEIIRECREANPVALKYLHGEVIEVHLHSNVYVVVPNGLLYAWGVQELRKLGWSWALTQSQAEEILLTAVTHAYKKLLAPENTQGGALRSDKGSPSAWLRSILRNRIKDWRKKRGNTMPSANTPGDKEIRRPEPLTKFTMDGEEVEREDLGSAPAASWAVDVDLLMEDAKTAHHIVWGYVETLQTEPGHRVVVSEFFTRRLGTDLPELNQTELAELAARVGFPLSQATASRALNRMFLALTASLRDPDLALDSRLVDRLLNILDPKKHPKKDRNPETQS